MHKWLVQKAAPPNGAPDEPDVHREQDNAGWGAWPAPAAPPLPQLPPYLMNFQAWLAAQGLQVQDGIVPDNNISNNAMQAWHDSITSSGETETDSGSSTFDLLVIPDQVTAVAPLVDDSLMISVEIHNQGLRFGLSANGDALMALLLENTIPRQQLNSAIFSALRPMMASFGPWRSGLGMQQHSFQVEF